MTELGCIPYTRSDGSIGQYPQSFSLEDTASLLAFMQTRGSATLLAASRGQTKGQTLLRHDIDHSLDQAVEMAKLEHDNGICGSFYALHTAGYWNDPELIDKLKTIQGLGHEVGIHHNSLSAARLAGAVNDELYGTARVILHKDLGKLRQAGIDVAGCAAHASEHHYNNIGLWGDFEMASFGLEYEAYHLNQGRHYISDNRGQLRSPLIHKDGMQSVVLVHPEHWSLV